MALCGCSTKYLVFCSEVGGHVDHFTLRKRYYEALERAELRRIRFHDLRHCFGSAAITKLDPYAVQSYMGHQHYSTTQRYLHHKPRREDALALQEAFGSRSADRIGAGATADQVKANLAAARRPSYVPTAAAPVAGSPERVVQRRSRRLGLESSLVVPSVVSRGIDARTRQPALLSSWNLRTNL